MNTAVATGKSAARDFRVATLLFLAGIMSLSPIFLYTPPVKGNVFSLLCILLAFVFYKKMQIKASTFLVVMLTLLLALLPAVYWFELKLLLLPIYFLSAVAIASRITEGERRSFVTLSSTILLLVLIGCWIGFVYVFLGGEAIVSFPNEDGRMNGWYLTTLSNSKVLRVIRPCGIFDEPGTLSFVTCMIAALRHTLKMDRRRTWMLLGLGLITLSVAHLFYAALHLAAELKKSTGKALKYVVLIGGLASVAVLFIPAVLEILSNNLFQRFVLQDGQFAGDNRSQLLLVALNYLDGRVFLWGLDVDCVTNAAACISKGYLQFGENPLAPLVLYGIFLSWPYYVLQGLLLAVFVVRLNFIALAIFALLLQRPSMMAFGYALLVAIAVLPILPALFKRSSTTRQGRGVLLQSTSPGP